MNCLIRALINFTNQSLLKLILIIDNDNEGFSPTRKRRDDCGNVFL